MIESDSNPVRSGNTAIVIDFETAARRIKFDRLVVALLHLASNESVRVIEALASTMANSLRSGRAIQQFPTCDSVGTLSLNSYSADADRNKITIVRQVAHQAMKGTLNDPTHGANAFHRVETAPEWSKDMIPSAIFGSFLFYRL